MLELSTDQGQPMNLPFQLIKRKFQLLAKGGRNCLYRMGILFPSSESEMGSQATLNLHPAAFCL
jgi:hypothetical protein